VVSAKETDWPVLKRPGAGEKVGEAATRGGGGVVPPEPPLLLQPENVRARREAEIPGRRSASDFFIVDLGGKYASAEML
jgi:hypothetical protein